MDPRLETARSLGLDQTAAEVCAALGTAGIRVLLLKGPALATWLYDDGTVRPYGDVDLLVAPTDFQRAERVLAALGYVADYPARSDLEKNVHERVWMRDGTHIDLHRSLWGVGVDAAVAWPVLSNGSETMAVGGGRLQALGRPARALHVALHAAQHGRRHPKPEQDLVRALARLPFTMWQEAADIARRLGAAEAMGAGIRLAPGGSEVATRLGLPQGGPLVVQASAGSTARGVEVLAELLDTPGIGARVARLARLLVPSGSQVRSSLPPARRSRVGLMFGYVWLPLLRISRFPRAALALARVSLEDRRTRRL